MVTPCLNPGITGRSPAAEIHSSCRGGSDEPEARTPTTVRGSPFTVSVRPTARGSAPKSRRQRRSERTTLRAEIDEIRPGEGGARPAGLILREEDELVGVRKRQRA